MEQNIWLVPRCASCWLDEKNVVVISIAGDNGHCELLNTVSVVFAEVCPDSTGLSMLHFRLTFFSRFRQHGKVLSDSDC